MYPRKKKKLSQNNVKSLLNKSSTYIVPNKPCSITLGYNKSLNFTHFSPILSLFTLINPKKLPSNANIWKTLPLTGKFTQALLGMLVKFSSLSGLVLEELREGFQK